MNEFCEPWQIGEQTTDAPCSNANIEIANSGSVVAHAHKGGLCSSIAADDIANRIILCVNSLAGIPNSELENTGFAMNLKMAVSASSFTRGMIKHANDPSKKDHVPCPFVIDENGELAPKETQNE